MIKFSPIVLLLAVIPIVQEKNEELSESSVLVPFFLDGTLSTEFFASQVETLELEKDLLRKTARELKTEWQKSIAIINGHSLTDSEKETCRLGFERSASELIEEALTPQQLKTIGNLVEQRSLMLQTRCRNFELPMIYAVKSGQKLENSKVDFASIRNSYETKKSEEFRNCLGRIRAAGVKLEGFREQVELHQNVEKIDTRSLTKRPEVTIDWGEDEFTEYQHRRKAFYLINSRSENLAPLLGMIESQIQQVEQMVLDSRANRNPDDFMDPSYARIMLAIEDDSLKTLQSEIRRKLQITNRLEQELADDIANNVLLPHQVKIIERLAEFGRSVYESKFGDEFGAIAAWIDHQEAIKHSEKERLRGIVTKERTRYHEKMRLLRDTLCDETLNCIPDDLKEEFLAKFGGVLYDVDSEKVARWDEARSRRT